MGRKDAFGIALKAVIVKDGHFLILKRSKISGGYKDIWEFPGGGLEEGERYSEALCREIKEETGLTVKMKEPLSVWDAIRKDGTQVVGITFWCEFVDGNVSLSDEHLEHAWVSAATIHRYPVFPKILEEVASWATKVGV